MSQCNIKDPMLTGLTSHHHTPAFRYDRQRCDIKTSVGVLRLPRDQQMQYMFVFTLQDMFHDASLGLSLVLMDFSEHRTLSQSFTTERKAHKKDQH